MRRASKYRDRGPTRGFPPMSQMASPSARLARRRSSLSSRVKTETTTSEEDGLYVAKDRLWGEGRDMKLTLGCYDMEGADIRGYYDVKNHPLLKQEYHPLV